MNRQPPRHIRPTWRALCGRIIRAVLGTLQTVIPSNQSRDNVRDKVRRKFLQHYGWGDAAQTALPSDASTRRYFRLTHTAQNESALLMDDAARCEHTRAFAAVTRHLHRIKLRAPKIYAADHWRGLMLLEDLGEQTFTQQLAQGAPESDLYERAIDALTKIARTNHRTIALPRYTITRALGEANLLLDWHLPATCREWSARAPRNARKSFARIWQTMLRQLPPLPDTLVLRDFHIDNLMLSQGECALLDYQDALFGSPGYDLASLLEDARRDIDESFAERMLQRYLTHHPAICEQALREHFIIWGAQRHCKVAGIFTRLSRRDSKHGYLQHLPRVVHLLTRRLSHPSLAPLRNWLDQYVGELRATVD